MLTGGTKLSETIIFQILEIINIILIIKFRKH